MAQSSLQKIIEYILDNLFDMITIIIAAYLVIRHQYKPFGPEDLPNLITGILAVMGFLAVSGLWDRNRRLNRIERLSKQSRDLVHRRLNEKPHAWDFFITEHQLSNKTFDSATEIIIMGITLTRTTREHMFTLGKRLVAGATIRIIIVDPTKDTVLEELALRTLGDTTPEYWRNRLQSIVTIINAIATTPGSTGNIKIGYLPYIPSFGFVLIDPEESHGFGFVELYHHKSVEPVPQFELKASHDPFWYAYYKRQYDILWNSCRIEQLPKATEIIDKKNR